MDDEGHDDQRVDPSLCVECGHKKQHIEMETVCTNCGLHYGYDFVNEYIDFSLNKYKIRRKSVYNRKYHIENTLFKFNLTRTERNEFNKYITKVEQSYDQINNHKAEILKLEYIYFKIFELMKLPEKQKLCRPVKGKAVLDRYERIWKQICELNNWQYM